MEALIDSVAAEFAFYRPAFCPIVLRLAKRNRLDFNIVEAIQANYAPSASLLSTIKAMVKYWPRPAAALTAEFRGRVNAPNKDQALRVTLQGAISEPGHWPQFLPEHAGTGRHADRPAFQTGGIQDGREHLGKWVTSRAIDSLRWTYSRQRRIGTHVYALVSA